MLKNNFVFKIMTKASRITPTGSLLARISNFDSQVKIKNWLSDVSYLKKLVC